MLIKMMLTAALVAVTGLGIASGLVYLNQATRRQQITEDLDGIFRSSLSVLTAKITQSGGPYRFAITHLSGGSTERVDPLISNTLSNASVFQNVFNIPMTVDATTLEQNRSFLGVRLEYTFEIYKFGSTPGTYEKITGPTRLSEIAYFRLHVKPALGFEASDGLARRGAEQIISL